MPAWLWKKLNDGPKIIKKQRLNRAGGLITQDMVENETPGIVPVLAQLSELDRDIDESFFCHPAVQHVFALPKEGGFCGYRNIQMLITYLQGTKAPGYDKFPGRTPTIPKLQDMIESAWDMGYGSIGRSQTGGIKGTRKYIGTPEVRLVALSSDSWIRLTIMGRRNPSSSASRFLACLNNAMPQAACQLTSLFAMLWRRTLQALSPKTI